MAINTSHPQPSTSTSPQSPSSKRTRIVYSEDEDEMDFEPNSNSSSSAQPPVSKAPTQPPVSQTQADSAMSKKKSKEESSSFKFKTESNFVKLISQRLYDKWLSARDDYKTQKTVSWYDYLKTLPLYYSTFMETFPLLTSTDCVKKNIQMFVVLMQQLTLHLFPSLGNGSQWHLSPKTMVFFFQKKFTLMMKALRDKSLSGISITTVGKQMEIRVDHKACPLFPIDPSNSKWVYQGGKIEVAEAIGACVSALACMGDSITHGFVKKGEKATLQDVHNLMSIGVMAFVYGLYIDMNWNKLKDNQTILLKRRVTLIRLLKDKAFKLRGIRRCKDYKKRALGVKVTNVSKKEDIWETGGSWFQKEEETEQSESEQE